MISRVASRPRRVPPRGRPRTWASESTVRIKCNDKDTVLGDVSRWLAGPYADRIWGRYGLADGVNFDDPAAEWVAPDVHAITVGPEFLAFASDAPETALGPVFNEVPAVKRGLAVAFEKGGPR